MSPGFFSEAFGSQSPRRPFLFVVQGRDKKNLLRPVFTQTVDPSDYHMRRESPAAGDWIYEAGVAGDPKTTLDIVFVAEGYTASGKDKFKADVDRMAKVLFEVEPYRSARERISIRGVFRPSAERSMDEPRQRAYRKTVLDAGFNAFDLDRYMLIEKDHRLHDLPLHPMRRATIVPRPLDVVL